MFENFRRSSFKKAGKASLEANPEQRELENSKEQVGHPVVNKIAPMSARPSKPQLDQEDVEQNASGQANLHPFALAEDQNAVAISKAARTNAKKVMCGMTAEIHSVRLTANREVVPNCR